MHQWAHTLVERQLADANNLGGLGCVFNDGHKAFVEIGTESLCLCFGLFIHEQVAIAGQFGRDVALAEKRPEDGFLFGYVGRINRDKGINELLSAFRSLQKKYDNIYLALVGMIDDTNPIDPENLAYAQKDAHIVLTGNVPSSEVYPYMAMFDVLTHPTYREGFGKVLQEAMGVGIPIITTNVPGPSEVVEDQVSGILVEAMNAQNLAEKMEILYADADLRRRFAAAGRKRAETYFDRPIMLDNILEDLNATLRRNKMMVWNWGLCSPIWQMVIV